MKHYELGCIGVGTYICAFAFLNVTWLRLVDNAVGKLKRCIGTKI